MEMSTVLPVSYVFLSTLASYSRELQRAGVVYTRWQTVTEVGCQHDCFIAWRTVQQRRQMLAQISGVNASYRYRSRYSRKS